jgi:hypothetical protein
MWLLSSSNTFVIRRKTENAEIEVVGPAGGAAQTRPARTLARWFVAWWLPVVAAATFLAPNSSLGGSLVSR